MAGTAGGQAPVRDRREDETSRGTAVIRGVVLAADSGTPLRRAQVRVLPQGAGSPGLAQTDGQGRFEVAQLAAGRYTIVASRSGYVTTAFGQRSRSQGGTTIELAEGQALEKVNVALARGGAISGRIVDEFGEPVASAEVTVQRFAFVGGARRVTGAGSEGGDDRTDDLGQFRLYGLTPGEYYVSASFRSMDFMPPMAAASSSTEGFAPSYFPGTTSLAEARRIVVRAGQDVPNISFALVSARLGRITGRVTTSTGEPLVGGMMMVVPRRDDQVGGGFGMNGAQVRPDGSFQTGPLAPGNYSLIVQERNGPSGPSGEVARVDVQLAGEDIRDLFIVTGPPGIVKGRIVSDDGSALPFKPGQVRIFLQPRDPSRFAMGMRPSVVNDDWTFELFGATDAVRLVASVDLPGGGWSLRHAWKDSVDLLDTAVDISPGQTVEDVDLVFTRKTTELSGLISDDRNQPVTDAWVVVFPEDKERWTVASRYLRPTRPDTSGKYTVRLTPFDGYRIIVVRGLEDGQYSDPEFLTRALEHATSFRIEEGEAKVLNLRLTDVR